MNIPDEAVEAARNAMKLFELREDPDGTMAWENYARVALESAAPHMRIPAAEKAMRDIKALLDEYFSDSTRIVEVDVVMSLARIVGRYDMERIGEAK